METVDELTGNEDGVWRVTTIGSTHIVNFIRGTITRVPGAGRSAGINDVERPLRTLDACKVGQVGRWTMIANHELIDYYWHRSSTIQCIERLSGKELLEVNTQVALQNIAAGDGLCSAAETAETLSVDEEDVHDMFAAGQLLGLIWREELVFPGVQFVPGESKVQPFVEPLVTAAAELGRTVRGVVFWLYSPTTYFGGDRPVDHADQPDVLVSAYRAEAGVQW